MLRDDRNNRKLLARAVRRGGRGWLRFGRRAIAANSPQSRRSWHCGAARFWILSGCVLHFVVALSIPVQLVVLAGGIIATGMLRRDIGGDTALSFVGAAGLCLFVLLHPQAIATYDDGLYYLQTFKWNCEFPITLGLANLHGRLAYNSILFLIAPLTDFDRDRLDPEFISGHVCHAISVVTPPSDRSDRPPRQHAVLVYGATPADACPGLGGRVRNLEGRFRRRSINPYFAALCLNFYLSEKCFCASGDFGSAGRDSQGIGRAIGGFNDGTGLV